MRLLGPCCLCALLVCGTVFAQQDMGVITGLVTDATGAAVGGAHMVATNIETNEKREVETQVTGTYTIGPLRLGTYQVAVEKAGFKKEVWSGIVLHAQDRVRTDFKLSLGQVTETVSVTDEAPILQSETASLGDCGEPARSARAAVERAQFPAARLAFGGRHGGDAESRQNIRVQCQRPADYRE